MTVGAVFRTRASAVWLLLVTLTLSSWVLGTMQDSDGEDRGASLVIIVVAAFKIRCVGAYFMELGDAPGALRWTFEGYCVALAILLGVMYLLA
jgi:hypothetical protein